MGATIGPAVMTGVLAAGRPWQWGYAGVGIAQLALAGCFGLTRARWSAAGGREDAAGRPTTPNRSAPLLHTLRLPGAWLGIAVFFVYAGLEVAAGTWAYTLFTEGRTIPAAIAGPWVSVYWGGLTVGRLLFGAVAPFAPIAFLLRLSLAGIVAGAGLIWLDPTTGLSFLGLAMTGLSLAPIFPSLIAGTPARLGAAHATNGIGFQVAAAVLGGSTLPTLVGVLARRAGLESIGPALLAAAILLLALHEALVATSPPASRGRDA
jgi:fucose permease